MNKSKKIKVLAIDDSLLFREAIARAITADPQIEIAPLASNPIDARDKIIETNPDVIVCDVEMPRMNGIEFLRQLLPQRFIPVVMVSSLSSKVFEAIEAGAVDFVAKPEIGSLKIVDSFWTDLIYKIKAAASVKSAPIKADRAVRNILENKSTNPQEKLIAIGASTGGTEAIYSIIKALPPTMPGIVIVQHIPPVFSKMFAQRLDNQTALNVKEAQTGDYVDPGTVLIAPGDKHMKVKKIGSRYRVECFIDEKVNGHCPSVDVLFESVAKEVGSNAIGIQLTGMGYDGAKGLLSIKRKGGRTIGQDEASSVVYGMPKVAYEIGGVEFQSPLQNIPQLIINLLNR